MLFASRHRRITQDFAIRMAQAFERRGIDFAERVAFMPSFLPHGEYLRLNQLCDLMIDTVHWSGGNTSLDALASGLPVVTLPGRLMRGRQSQAMLRAIGAGDLIASNSERYVEIAEQLGRDIGARESMKARILANRGALFDRDEPLHALEAFLERVARAE